MEFNEKLQELRKARSLTQEELAKAVFVSRTAVSKWESGRGYPSIDSLKELSRFFHVSIDELIGPNEIVAVAEDDKKRFVGKYSSLICGTLDVLLALLLFVPAFGNGSDDPSAVSLLVLSGTSPWVKGVFEAIVATTVLCGFFEVIASKLGKPNWSSVLQATGIALSVACVGAFIAARQPYAGIFCFALLLAKALLLFEGARSASSE
ncbi:MAG: helix-turn-helix transcriptional regulator [Coriobacteriales bacterium]|nr:helix-turn-helix transcriptional regulator [Coriobacteriales bacterium]